MIVRDTTMFLWSCLSFLRQRHNHDFMVLSYSDTTMFLWFCRIFFI
nr:MAG TPA: hypothetical protein [Caudoviricetes sp.]